MWQPFGLETRRIRVHIGMMTEKPPKRPRDRAQLAKLMIDIASGEVEDRTPTAEKEQDGTIVAKEAKIGREGEGR